MYIINESIERPIAENIQLDNGIYEGYFYSWILEIHENKYTTLFGVRCTKEFCGGLKKYRIENGCAYEV